MLVIRHSRRLPAAVTCCDITDCRENNKAMFFVTSNENDVERHRQEVCWLDINVVFSVPLISTGKLAVSRKRELFHSYTGLLLCYSSTQNISNLSEYFLLFFCAFVLFFFVFFSAVSAGLRVCVSSLHRQRK